MIRGIDKARKNIFSNNYTFKNVPGASHKQKCNGNTLVQLINIMGIAMFKPPNQI